ncbi:MAG: DUF4129 domain-containing protein [Anaerolineae bacterium]|nr:DUF4129 domain-containing protein [Anaerolineae bacterium]
MNNSHPSRRAWKQIAPGLWLGALLVIMLNAQPLDATAPPLPLDAYWRQLSETRARVAELIASAETEAAQGLEPLAAQWETIEAIALEDGAVIPVDHSYLVGLMQTGHPNLAEIETTLVRLQETLPSLKSAVDPNQAQEALDGILARPEFQWEERELNPLERWWKDLVERFLEWLQRLLGDSTGIAVGGGQLLNYLIAGVGILGIGILLLYLLRGLQLNFAGDGELKVKDGASGMPLTASAALQEAQTRSTGGDYRTAMRYLYLSLLLLLDEREILRYDHTLTNREYARSLARLPQFAATFSRVVDVFDRVWYGHHEINVEEYTEYAAQVEDLEQSHENTVA